MISENEIERWKECYITAIVRNKDPSLERTNSIKALNKELDECLAFSKDFAVLLAKYKGVSEKFIAETEKISHTTNLVCEKIKKEILAIPSDSKPGKKKIPQEIALAVVQ